VITHLAQLQRNNNARNSKLYKYLILNTFLRRPLKYSAANGAKHHRVGADQNHLRQIGAARAHTPAAFG
jgi:hypothetical protein